MHNWYVPELFTSHTREHYALVDVELRTDLDCFAVSWPDFIIVDIPSISCRGRISRVQTVTRLLIGRPRGCVPKTITKAIKYTGTWL